MNTAIINIKVDPEVKSKAQKVAAELGLSLSSLINAYLKQLIRTREVLFSLDEETTSDYLPQQLSSSSAQEDST